MSRISWRTYFRNVFDECRRDCWCAVGAVRWGPSGGMNMSSAEIHERLVPSKFAMPTAQKSKIPRRISRLGMPVAGFVGIITLWFLVTWLLPIPDYLIPTPHSVVVRMVRDWRILVDNSTDTLIEILAGFFVSVIVAVPLAFLIVMNRSVERVILPMLVASQAIPKVAIAPIFVIWLGFGLLPKIAISFLIAFFPILVSTVAGLKSVELDMIDLVRSMGATQSRIMLRVRFPAALPQIFSGLKVAISLSVVGAIVGEFIGADHGLGYLLLSSTGSLDGPMTGATMVVLVFLGISLFTIVERIERVAIRWHVSVRAEEAQQFGA